MDNSTQTQQPNLAQPTQVPNQPAVNPTSNKKGFFFIIIGIIILVLAVGVYYLSQRSTKDSNLLEQQQSITNPTTAPTQPLSPTSIITASTNTITTEPAPLLPSGWTYKSNGVCAVKFAIPPKQDPYYQVPDTSSQPSVTNDEGRFWDFPRGVTYPNLLSKFPTGYENHKQVNAWYTTAEGASGYVSSAISVSCLPNINNFDSQAMLDTLKINLQKYNQGNSTERMESIEYTLKSSKENIRWNQKVYDLVILEYSANPGGQPITNDVEYTIFATPNFIYEVRVMGETDNTFVKETAKKIFDNLQFTSN